MEAVLNPFRTKVRIERKIARNRELLSTWATIPLSVLESHALDDFTVRENIVANNQ